jgi:hypothetical protein
VVGKQTQTTVTNIHDYEKESGLACPTAHP